MGDIYHQGNVIGSNDAINDITPSSRTVYSSQKIEDTFGCNEATAGTYTLHCTIDASGNKTYSWS